MPPSKSITWKAWATPLLIFAGICIAVDLFFTSRFVLGSPLSDSFRIRHLYQDNGDDIPVFGSSKARNHYSPTDMGMPAYSYGIDGASYDVTDVLLQIELAKARRTPIIIELQYFDSESLGSVSTYIPFAFDPRFRALLSKFHELRWRYFVPGVRYYGYYDAFTRDMLLPNQKVTDGFGEWINRGPFSQRQFDEIVKVDLTRKVGYVPEQDWDRKLGARIAAHSNRLFFLVISPYDKSYFVNFKNLDKFSAVKQRLSSLPNVVLLDWSRLYDTDTFFQDTVHLRREGAADFSRRLGEKIRQVLRQRGAVTAAAQDQAALEAHGAKHQAQ
jgi:hypothetical protein